MSLLTKKSCGYSKKKPLTVYRDWGTVSSVTREDWDQIIEHSTRVNSWFRGRFVAVEDQEGHRS